MPYKDPAMKRRNDARYREANRRLLAEKQGERYRSNRDRAAKGARAWRAAHPDTVRLIQYANSANVRALRWGADERLDVADLRAVAGACEYCGAESETWDHRVPLSRGGRNHRSNLAPSCVPCNRAKAHRTADEFLAGVSVPRPKIR